MKDTLTEIKNNLQGNNCRVDEAENQINDLEHKEAKNNQSEQQQEKKSKKMRTGRTRNWKFEKIMKENFPNLVKEIDIQVQEHRESQTRWMQRGPLQDTSQLKCQRLKIKRTLKAAREEKLVASRGVPIRLSAHFSKETSHARRDWQEIF